jgi:hypothetical protein
LQHELLHCTMIVAGGSSAGNAAQILALIIALGLIAAGLCK